MRAVIQPNNIFTCESAAVPSELTSICRGKIFYPAGRIMVNATTDTPLAPDWPFSLVSFSTQESIAHTLMKSITNGDFASPSQSASSLVAFKSTSCASAINVFSCAIHFPYCPFTNAGVSHIPICRDQCLALKTTCGLETLDCSLQAGFRDKQCFKIPDNGNFLLSTDVGPYYDLPSAYVVVAFVWSILVVGWLAGLLRHGFSNATRLHRFMLSVPLIKLFIVSVAASFWVSSL